MSPYSHRIIWILSCVILVAHHVYAYQGHYGYDDMEYARLAADLLRGNWDASNHYSHRIFPVFCTAIAYRIFGINDFASSLPALCISFATLYIVFRIFRDRPWQEFALTYGLIFTSSWWWYYSDKLMPDIYVAFFGFLAFAIIYLYRSSVHVPESIFAYAMCWTGSLFLGFLSKETIILMSPVILTLCVRDLLRKKHSAFWIASIGFGLFWTFIFFLGEWWATGNAWQRFDAIRLNRYLSDCSYDQQPLQVLIERISTGFWKLCLQQYLWVPLCFLLALWITKPGRKIFKEDKMLVYFGGVAALLYLSSNFMTISYDSYSPMCLDPRHYLYLTPFAAIGGAIAGWKGISNRNWYIPFLLLIIISAILTWYFEMESAKKVFIPAAILCIIGIFIHCVQSYQKYIWIGFLLLFCIKPFYQYQYANSIHFAQQKKIIQEQILQNKDSITILTDAVQVRLGKYAQGFPTQSSIQWLEFPALIPDTLSKKKVILLDNWYTHYLTGKDWDNKPEYVKQADKTLPIIYKDSITGIHIYQIFPK